MRPLAAILLVGLLASPVMAERESAFKREMWKGFFEQAAQRRQHKHEREMEEFRRRTESRNSQSLGLAIVVAAAVIGGAIYLSRKQGDETKTPPQDDLLQGR